MSKAALCRLSRDPLQTDYLYSIWQLYFLWASVIVVVLVFPDPGFFLSYQLLPFLLVYRLPFGMLLFIDRYFYLLR